MCRLVVFGIRDWRDVEYLRRDLAGYFNVPLEIRKCALQRYVVCSKEQLLEEIEFGIVAFVRGWEARNVYGATPWK